MRQLLNLMGCAGRPIRNKVKQKASCFCRKLFCLEKNVTIEYTEEKDGGGEAHGLQ